jgi:multiple sugar transport system substrate-binding protein
MPRSEEVADLPGGIGNVFAGGLAAMHVDGSWVIPTLIQRAGFRWDVADWPAGPRGRVTGSLGSGYGITRDSKARDAAWLYLSTFLGKDKDMLMQELATTGRGSPGRKSFWPAFEKSPGAPSQVGIIAPALEKYSVIARPIGLAARDINRIVSAQFNEVWAGKLGPADAARAARREIDAAIAANK